MVITVCLSSDDLKVDLKKKSEKCNSHRNKAFVSSLEDTRMGPMQQLKMEVKFFTSL